MRHLLQAALLPDIVRNALKIALLVGSVLNIINQGNHWLQDHQIVWWSLFLNYLVPYCVSSYSAAKHELARNAINGYTKR